MVYVRVKNGDVSGAIRIFKKKVNEAGIMRELKAHDYALTKSQKRRLKHKEAAKRTAKLKRVAEELENGGGKKKPRADGKLRPNTTNHIRVKI